MGNLFRKAIAALFAFTLLGLTAGCGGGGGSSSSSSSSSSVSGLSTPASVSVVNAN
jgi:hypothetical protein